MVTQKEIQATLEQLIDPTNGKSLKENGGVRKIDLNEAENKVTIIIALADDKDPKKDQFQIDLMKKLKLDLKIGGVKVEYTKLNTRAAGETNILGKDSNVKFLAIASGKGGVGKSTITANLALALTRLGKRVGLIDADVYGSSINQIMEIEELPKQKGNLISPVYVEGVEVITTAMLMRDNKPLMWRGPMLQKILIHFLNDVDWAPDLDYILFDLPPGTGDVALDIQQFIPHARQILVTTPHPSASHVAVRAGKMAKELKHPIIGVIENMSYIELNGEKHRVFGKGGGAKVALDLETKLLAQLPLTQPENGKYHSLYLTGDSLAKPYEEIAQVVIADFEG